LDYTVNIDKAWEVVDEGSCGHVEGAVAEVHGLGVLALGCIDTLR
jgi:hypothetical protein